MALTISEVRELLNKLPKTNLGFFPTPLYKLENLSAELGIELYIKRDDFTGSNLFGGNKTRKLEYLIGKAKAGGCDHVFTYGAVQSNHAMQTVWAATKNGIKPVIYLAAIVPIDENDIKANLLLDRIYDAEIHIVEPLEGESFMETEDRSFEMAKEHIARLEAEGHKCMNIPVGGADETGSLGYIGGITELYEQADDFGGLISGEHGLGVSKRDFFFARTTPENVQLMNRIKLAFDPKKILNSNISYVE